MAIFLQLLKRQDIVFAMADKKSVKPGFKSNKKFNFSFKFLARFLVFGIISAVVHNSWNKSNSNSKSLRKSSSVAIANSSLKYWGVCLFEWNENGNLRTMNRVFDRLNFVPVNALEGDDWDVLWSIEYPFDVNVRKNFEPIYKQLKPHQRINHIVGISHMTAKYFMNTRNQDFDFLMKSFKFPNDIGRFKDFAAANPHKSFVHKNLDNRGVRVVTREEVDFETDELFYQEFMDKPFLIDDRTFDLGVFVLISSINPLRIYRYDTEILLRFCPEPYYPFNPKNIEQYVIYETHKHFYDMPSLNPQHAKFGYSFKDVLADHLERRGYSFEALQARTDEVILKLILRLEPSFVSQVSNLNLSYDLLFYNIFQRHSKSSTQRIISSSWYVSTSFLTRL